MQPYVSAAGEYGTVLWGMIRIPYEMTNHHFLAVGATGSGKTVLIHALMKSLFPRIKTDKKFRAFIYDDKPDFMPFARAFKLDEHGATLDQYVWSLDPFDANGFAWDIASDVTTKAEAMQVASVLAPVDSGVPDTYWQQATQDFLAAVLLSFHEANGKTWSLRDVMLSFTSEPRLRTILARSLNAQRMVRFYLGANSLGDVLAVLQSKLGPYGVAASLYSHAKEKKSVREWSKSNAILLVTGRSIFSQAMKPINQAIFRMVSLLLLNEQDDVPGSTDSTETDSNWIFLDEIREIGKLQGYHELANKGRSKGVRLVLGFQSIEGLSAEHGEAAANEIANLCGHRTFLHTTSVTTRNWEADQVGKVVVDETVFTYSQSVSKNDWSSGVSWQTKRQTRQAMEAADFDQNLKLATPENGVTSLNFIPYVGVYVSWVPWDWVLTNLHQPEPEHFSETLRSGKEQMLV
jgi:type IV secretory pathway TraG/TraD family ATPase VirD4